MTDHKFTDEEIKTGLRCLSGEIILCKFCAFSHLEDRGFACKKNVANAALTLINRQKASLQEVITLNSKLEAENAKLQRLLDSYEKTSGNKKAKSEAIKEFANNVVQELWKLNWHYGQLPCSEEDKTIQRAIKECIAVVERNTKVMTEGNHESQNT
jgi:regulator of replication initiation timing